MLILTRKVGESIAIDDNITIVVVKVKGKQVRLGIKAPKETKVHREEIYEQIKSQNQKASKTPTDAFDQIDDSNDKEEK